MARKIGALWASVEDSSYLTKKFTIAKAQALFTEYLTTAQFRLRIRLYDSPQIADDISAISSLLNAQKRSVGQEKPIYFSRAFISSDPKHA